MKLAYPRSDGKFVVSSAGEAYDARDRGLNRKSSLILPESSRSISGRLVRRSRFVNSVSNWTRHLNCAESDRPQLLGELTLRPKWEEKARLLAL